MKTIIYTCDLCGREIDLDKLVTIKVSKSAKHFCETCVTDQDLKVITEKK